MGKFGSFFENLGAKRVAGWLPGSTMVWSLSLRLHALEDFSRILQRFPSKDRQRILNVIRRTDTVQNTGDTGRAGQTPQRLS